MPAKRPKKPPTKRRRDPEPVHPILWTNLLTAGTHDARRLDSVVRFSSIPVTFSETTAAHSFWVSLYSLMVWQVLQSTPWRRIAPTLEEVLHHAVTHDVAESVTGDVVRTLKYSSPGMKKAVDEAETLLVSQLLPHEVKRALPRNVSPEAKAIVKAADFLSLWQFMRREAARHNLEILPYYLRMIRDLREQSASVPAFLSGLYVEMVKEAQEVLRDCFGDLADNPRWARCV